MHTRISIHEVTSVTVERRCVRDHPTCHDHDAYDITISGDAGVASFHLYTAESGVDVGLDRYLDDTAERLERVLARVDRLREACDLSEGTVPGIVALALAALIEPDRPVPGCDGEDMMSIEGDAL